MPQHPVPPPPLGRMRRCCKPHTSPPPLDLTTAIRSSEMPLPLSMSSPCLFLLLFSLYFFLSFPVLLVSGGTDAECSDVILQVPTAVKLARRYVCTRFMVQDYFFLPLFRSLILSFPRCYCVMPSLPCRAVCAWNVCVCGAVVRGAMASPRKGKEAEYWARTIPVPWAAHSG